MDAMGVIHLLLLWEEANFPLQDLRKRAWLNVEATDAKGKVYHLDVDKKGFEGEEYTIS